jgi:palmitoyl-protein thioesterase
LTPTTYWHDLNTNRYQRGSTFLAIINNEREINADYAENLRALARFVLVKYEADEAIVPNDSTFFGYWSEQKKPISLEESELFKHDKLGLKKMKERGQLVFLVSPGGHLELVEDWFVHNVLKFLMMSE